MKNNVDLTENQIFSRRTLQENYTIFVISAARGKHPWESNVFSEVSTDDELNLGHQKKSLIALGDKKQRAEVAELRKMDNVNYCDCCGARMNLKPWDREIGLCHKCNEHCEKQDKVKFPWSRKSIGIGERRISVFDFN